jgi:hypothetical protein
LSNRVYTGQSGISGSADGLLFKLNDVRDQSFQGIRVQGSYPIVQGNRVEGDSSDASLLVSCTDCFGGTVSSNKITGGAGYGLMAIADGPGLLVERNTVVRSRFGLSLNGEGIRATLNQATEIGQDFRDDCIEVFGDRHAVVQNTARACARAGFYVGGSSNLLERNTVLGAFENGITVNGDDENGGFYSDNVLDGNKPSGSAGQGVAIINGAVGTVVRNNIATKNRLDFCNDGTGTVTSGNTFPVSADTGGVDCVIAH